MHFSRFLMRGPAFRLAGLYRSATKSAASLTFARLAIGVIRHISQSPRRVAIEKRRAIV
jgi:hypothetical protein